jgi:integrase
MVTASWLLSAYLESVYLRERPGMTPGSAHQLRVSVHLLDRWLGHSVALADLSRPFLCDWLRWLLDRGTAEATCNRKSAAIMSVWRDAGKGGVAPPALPPPNLLEPNRLPVVIDVAALHRLLDTAGRAPGDWGGVPAGCCWRALILLVWDTAVRIGSALAARMEDVDLELGTWFVPAKHSKGHRGDRLYHLHPQTVEALRVVWRPGRALLFPLPWNRRKIWKLLAPLLVSAGIPADRQHKFHCLRRTSESYAAATRGAAWAAEAVGHGLGVALKSYISPVLCPGPRLIDAIPRP